MPALLQLLVVLIVLTLLATIVIALVRMNRSSRSGRGSGVANLMTDLDAMLQPHHPTAAVIQKAKEGEEEHDDDGDDKDPDLERPRRATNESRINGKPSRTQRPRHA